MLKKEYYIGLDLGVTSVGWSVMDRYYNLLKFKGKNMWGVRLFAEGNTAQVRRMNRSSRRRYQRRRQRINLMKQLLNTMIIKTDPLFFIRLEKGCLTQNDKGYVYNLFNDKSFDDKTYYRKYPTIYHLRQDLCESKEKKDPRLIYLAIHHILKYRGNFLYEHQDFNINSNKGIKDGLFETLVKINELYNVDYSVSEEMVDEILNILNNTKKKRKEKIDEVKKYLNIARIDKNLEKAYDELLKLVLRMSCDISKVFNTKVLDENDKPYKITLEDELDEKRDFIESQLQDQYFYFVKLEEVASYLVLGSILHGEDSISKSMISKYENHKNELQQLKQLIKTYLPNKYAELFRLENKDNYVKYVNSKVNKDDFYKYLKSLLNLITDQNAQNEISGIQEKIELFCYLEKQTQKDNAAIPYQLHLKELKMIIDNQQKYYPELKENKEKLISLLTFRVPYYIGPLNPKSKFAWIERKNQQSIRPWNFEEEVNVVESAEGFIRRMTNMCTYLPEEAVLPKNSILYSKFMVLNELNKVRVDGKLIKLDFKKQILEELFMKKNVVKHQDILDFYHRNGIKATTVKGTQKEFEFASSLQSVRFFKEIYKEKFNESIDEIERLIEWSTVYEDSGIFKKRIQKEYPHLNEKTINKIVKKRFTGWGSLSRKLLEEIVNYDKYGNKESIMDVLLRTNYNFMQVINDKNYCFKEEIESANKIENEELTYEVIDKLQGSPKNKKAIWQAVKIIREIVGIMGCEPTQINVEFAREEQEKVRTDSRVKKLKDLYRSIEKDFDENEKQTYELLKKENENARLDIERLFLYYTQLGKCMYSGEPLDINQLSNYEVDHVLPRSHIKDDSLDNKVLVKKLENQEKAERLVLPERIINKQKYFWEKLFESKLISAKKYYNLIRRNVTTIDEIGFINRQLVETRQITKHVTNLLKNTYKNTTVVSVRAGLSHDFRLKNQIYKIRELNDYHHAQDAYITNVIGTFIVNKYPTLKKEFIFDDYQMIKKDIDKDKLTFHKKEGFILSQLNHQQRFDAHGELVWDGEKTIKMIKAICEYKDCFITRKVEQSKGQLFNVSIINAKEIMKISDKDSYKVIPVNSQRTQVKEYGGFKGINNAYGVAVEYQDKKKCKRTVISMPIMYATASEEKRIEYIRKETNDTVKIVKDKILFDTLIEINGQKLYLASASEWNNATQLLLSVKSKKILYAVLNHKLNKKIECPSEEEYLFLFDELMNKALAYYPMYKNGFELIKQNRELFINTEVYSNKGYVGKDDFICSLLKVLKANKTRSDIILGTKKICSSFGRLSGKNTDLNETTFIFNSVTGMYEKKYKL